MGAPLNDQRHASSPRRSNRGGDSPLVATLMLLNLGFWTWIQADSMNHQGFSWLRTCALIVSAFGAGIWFTRFPLIRRLLDGDRDQRK